MTLCYFRTLLRYPAKTMHLFFYHCKDQFKNPSRFHEKWGKTVFAQKLLNNRMIRWWVAVDDQWFCYSSFCDLIFSKVHFTVNTADKQLISTQEMYVMLCLLPYKIHRNLAFRTFFEHLSSWGYFFGTSVTGIRIQKNSLIWFEQS